MAAKVEFKYIIPHDDECDSPQVRLELDSDSDLMVCQDGNMLYLSLPQALAMHQSLGQMLVRHARSWGPVQRSLRAV